MRHIPNPQLRHNQRESSSRGRATGILLTVVLLLLAGASLLLFFGEKRTGPSLEDKKNLDREQRTDRENRVQLPLPPPPDVDFLADDGGVPPIPVAGENEEKVQEPAKTELEQEYERLVATYLQNLPPPKIGKEYAVELRNGSIVEGRLEEINPGRVVMRVRYGTIAYAVNELQYSSLQKLFPRRAAKLRALREIQNLQQRPAAVANGTLPVEANDDHEMLEQQEGNDAFDVQSAELEKEQQESVVTPEMAKTFYHTSPTPTPEHLKETIVAFGTWLEYQHRRIGGKVADRIFAKQEGEKVVLYLVLNPLFLTQDYDVRFQLAEGLWKFWSFRCEAAGLIRKLSDAHVVLVNRQNQVVGGSTPRNAADIWVEK